MSLFTSSDYGPSCAVSFFDLRDDGRNHQNLIRFLEVATTLDVPILPLTWDPALETLGPDGATGRVNQSPFNKKISLAYKRFNPHVTRPELSLENFRGLQYSSMISEITVLSSAFLRKHPNIIRLIGVGFELHNNNNDMFPVLVFAKASLGDLSKFRSQYSTLHSEVTMAICGKIANAVGAMHQCGTVTVPVVSDRTNLCCQGIAHGDIKPGNILVFQASEASALEIQVADFGFSSFDKTDSDLVKVARTEPWEAPEWHPNYFTLREAKQMDVYSFGLICMWLFFKDHSLVELGLPITIDTVFTMKEIDSTMKFQAMKRNKNELLSSALRLVEQQWTFEHDIKTTLKQLFELSLDTDPGKRASMEQLIDLFWSEENQVDVQTSTESILPSIPNWHGTIQVEKLFFHLEPVDFRVHSHITRSLTLTAEDAKCNVCAENASFQLALCYSFGFGVKADQQKSQELLGRSGKSPVDLSDILMRIKSSNPRANFMSGLAKMGYRSDLLRRYVEDGVFEAAIGQYRHMVQAREDSFGPSHFSTLRLRGILTDLLRSDRQFQEALENATKNIKNAGADVVSEDKLTMKTQLANIYRDMGNLEQAETLEREIIASRAEEKDANDLTQLHDRINLADLLVSSRRYGEALKILQAVHQESLQALGPNHPTTVDAKRSLAAAYDANGELQQAVDLGYDLEREKELSNGLDDPRRLSDICLLGIRLYRLGQKQRAIDRYNKAKSIVEKEPNHAEAAIVTVGNYASALMMRGNVDESILILRHLLPESERVLGANSQATTSIMGNLAAGFQKKGESEQAEALERRVLQNRRSILGETHADTLTAFANLRRNLFQQRKWSEATTVGLEERSIREAIPHTPDAVKISLISTLATSLTLTGDWEGAVAFFKQESVLRGKQGIATQSESLPAFMLATVCYVRLNRLPEAREQIQVLLETVSQPFEVEPNVFFDRLTFLGRTCMECGCHVEAEQVLRAGIGLAKLLPEKSVSQILMADLERLVSELPDEQRKKA